jgi:hypothetical protein
MTLHCFKRIEPLSYTSSLDNAAAVRASDRRPAVAGTLPGEGGLCSTGSNNNFGVVTGAASPGGFFGPDPGNRTIWLGANVKF